MSDLVFPPAVRGVTTMSLFPYLAMHHIKHAVNEHRLCAGMCLESLGFSLLFYLTLLALGFWTTINQIPKYKNPILCFFFLIFSFFSVFFRLFQWFTLFLYLVENRFLIYDIFLLWFFLSDFCSARHLPKSTSSDALTNQS